MKYRRISAVVILVVAGFAIYMAINSYLHNKIEEQVSLSYVYWSDALKLARNDNQTVDKFVRINSPRALVIEESNDSVLLREVIPIDSLICSEYSIDIRYTYSGGDSVRFGILTGKCSA